jgi:broad specificity phosphatase PhoE
MLLGYNLLQSLLISFLAITAFDFSLLLLQIGKGDQSTRWYLTQSVTNAVVVYFVLPDCIALLRDPASCLDAPSNSDIPLVITVSLHLYHCVSNYKSLTTLDWLHHLLGNMLVCGLAFPFHYGPLLSWGCLFVCGLPGGIDYFLLFLVKVKYINKMTEKKWNRILNMWVRCPGIVTFLPFAFTAMMEGRTSVPYPILAAQGILNFINGVYFADRVTANAAVAIFKENEMKRGGTLNTSNINTKQIIFIRHGQSIANKTEKDDESVLDAILTELGQKQADSWCNNSIINQKYLKKVDLCICSPLRRAMETASLVFRNNANVPIEVNRYAREKWWHLWQCRGIEPHSKLIEYSKTLCRKINNINDLSMFDEYWNPLKENELIRNKKSINTDLSKDGLENKLRSFLIQHKSKNIAISCHWGVIKTLLKIEPTNCEMVVTNLNIDTGTFEIVERLYVPKELLSGGKN